MIPAAFSVAAAALFAAEVHHKKTMRAIKDARRRAEMAQIDPSKFGMFPDRLGRPMICAYCLTESNSSGQCSACCAPKEPK